MKVSLFWHRRDLRFQDNAGLAAALQGEHPVVPLFIFDPEILDKLENRQDARVMFIFDEVQRLVAEAKEAGGTMLVRYGKPETVFADLLKELDVAAVHTNHDYEPYAATSAPNMKREVPLRYPGVSTDYAGASLSWDRAAVAAHIDLAFDWAKAQGLPPTRIVAGEFGCMRLWADCGAYLGDVMDAIDARGGHWAFYSFREDVWDGMDYELPVSVKPGQFYWLTEQGQGNKLPRDGQLMDLLKAGMKG